MPAPFEEMSTLDRVVHEPARLAILTALAACRSADFLFLQSLTGLTKGNLSGHLAKLERAGLVGVEPTFLPITVVLGMVGVGALLGMTAAALGLRRLVSV